MRCLLKVFSLFLLCGVLFAQSTPQVMPSFQEIMSDFAILQEDHAGNQKLLSDIDIGLKELSQTASADAILKNSLKLHREITTAIQALQQEQDKQVIFKNTISRYSGDRQLLRQEQSYISHYLDELQKYGRDQANVMVFLQKTLRQLNANIANMPPPPHFTGNFGIEFMLITAPKNEAFYVTKEPLTAEQICTIWKAMHPEVTGEEWQKIVEDFTQKGISMGEAQEIAACMGRLLGGFPCNLPAESQLNALREYGQTLQKAVWLGGKQLISPTEKEALSRFGMQVGRIWDPMARLGALHATNAVSSELTWAKYPELGCILTTAIDTGRAQKRAIIEKLLDEEEAAAAAEQVKEEILPDNTSLQEDAQ